MPPPRDRFDVEVHGVREAMAAFRRLVPELQRELDRGMIPQARYRGQAAVPFTVTRIVRVARAAGWADLQLRGFDDGE